MPDLKTAIARFGADVKAKLANPGATGEPEDQLRAPLEGLFADLAELCGFQREWLAAVGESSVSTLKTRPDYAITLVRVLDAINWHAISKGKPDARLYFYEDFLAVYDNKLRKLTGSYYTPPEVVEPMIRLVSRTAERHASHEFS
jgi:type I restriction-modification system DNA methylase subunit